MPELERWLPGDEPSNPYEEIFNKITKARENYQKRIKDLL